MTINLHVLPLEDVARVHVKQKCLLPSSINAFHCGTWVRCLLQIPNNGQKQRYVVCQMYQGCLQEPPAGSVYIDRAVTVGVDQELYDQRMQDAKIIKLEHLEEVRVSDVELTFTINMSFFHKIRKANLLEIAKDLLQAYCLINNCTVRNEELRHFGIEAIDVNSKIEHQHELQCFRITDETHMHISDVHLPPTELPKLKRFYEIGYEAALEELNDLVFWREPIRGLKNTNALVVGPVGCGKSALITYFVQKSRCNYFHISIGTILGQYPGEAECKIREIFSAARTFATLFKPKAPIIIHLEDLHLICPDIKRRSTKEAGGHSLRLCAQLNSLLDSINSSSSRDIICLATTSEVKQLHASLLCPTRFQQEININAFDVATRKSMFQLLYHRPLAEEIIEDVVAQTSGYVMSDLTMLVRSIEQRLLHDSTLDVNSVIRELLTKLKPASIRSAEVSVIKSEAGFDAIGGMDALKSTLKINVLTGLQRSASYKRFGLSLPKGILLYGPPGCAKTTIAKCLAAEAKMTFIATSSAEVYSPYVGCAEKFIGKLFDTARRHTPCLLFLDEIDTLVGCRSLGGATGTTNDVQTRILSTLLTEMDGIVHTRAAAEAYILVVAATNRPNMIDDALLRPGRFDQLIHVPAPDRNSRLSILELYRRNMPFAMDCNLVDIAERTQNYSGADICNLCNEAALHALLENMDTSEIKFSNFESILRNQKPSLSQKQIDSYFQFQKGHLR